MKQKTVIRLLIILFASALFLWAVPGLTETATKSKDNYPFGYYSSVKKKMLFRETDGRDHPLHDDDGAVYTDKDFDLALPLLNFRQLTVNSEMPDSIDGIAIEPQKLRMKQTFFRYSPKDKNTPDHGLYILYESLPKKARLESPGDLFRLRDKIEFVTAETNTVNREKSDQFQQALLKAGYTFPAQWSAGDMNIRKPYDEGYFSLDARGKLFHIKMVNGRPFVRDTRLDTSIEPLFFAMQEPADKRFYGFIFDRAGHVYILEEAEGKYRPLRLDIPAFNPDRDELAIMGNFLYWTVTVLTPQGKHYYALDTETLSQVRHVFVEARANRWDKVARFFPCYLTFNSKYSKYLTPEVHFPITK